MITRAIFETRGDGSIKQVGIVLSSQVISHLPAERSIGPSSRRQQR
jgi:hypothetical protein